jgi:hypothetical protein
VNAARRLIESLPELAPIRLADQRVELLIVGSRRPNAGGNKSCRAGKTLQKSTAAKLSPLPRHPWAMQSIH